jgi:hypothetical protein
MNWFGRVLLLGSFSVMTGLVFAQGVNAITSPAPSFALTIDIPSVIRPTSELLLETRYTNTTNHDLWMSGGCPLWQSFDIIVRNSAGVRVQKTSAGPNANCDRNQPISLDVSVPIHPGEAITNELMLDKLYDLSRSGLYTVQVALYDIPSKNTVTSNAIKFRAPQIASYTENAAADFSISISSPYGIVQLGWDIPIKIVLKNLSRHNLRLAVWEGNTPYGRLLDEFGSGLEVFDDDQKIAANLKQPSFPHSGDYYPGGAFLLTTIKPGEELQQTRALGRIYDFTKPGNYSVHTVLIDPTTGVAVKSNQIKFKLATPSSLASAAIPAKTPPFMVSIRPYPEFGSVEKLPLSICMTNISDQEVRLDNAITKDIIHVDDSAGKPVELTEAGRTLQKQFGSTGMTTVTVKSGESLCGIITVGTLFDFPAPGDYTVRVDRYDEPDALPNQTLQSLPIVQSNAATLAVAHSTS